MAVWGRCLAAAALLAVLAPAPATAADLREGFSAAAALDAELRGVAARRDAALARRARADALLPGAPVAGIGYRTDQATGNRGLREYEGEFDAPIWLPGEAAALRRAAEAQIAELDAQAARRRLLLAGEVRDAWWAWALAEAGRAAAAERVALARALERDTARQVRGGNLPQTEALLAAADLRDAEAALRTAAFELRAAALAFRTLAGAEPTPGPPEAPGARPAGPDPRVAAAQARIEAGRSEERFVAARDRANPEIGVQLRHERDAFGEPWGSRALLRLNIPLQNRPLQRERLAEARAAVASGIVGLSTAERAVAGALDTAREAEAAARAVLEATAAQHEAARRQAALFEQSFRAGQLPLVEVVRARGALANADAALRRARVGVGRAVSVTNQALGILPQ
jgi:cobalt-zinc-cadmium efflux system outer membrane protein